MTLVGHKITAGVLIMYFNIFTLLKNRFHKWNYLRNYINRLKIAAIGDTLPLNVCDVFVRCEREAYRIHKENNLMYVIRDFKDLSPSDVKHMKKVYNQVVFLYLWKEYLDNLLMRWSMFKTMLVDKIRHNDGVQAIEYAMVAAFIGLLMTLGLSMLGSNISNEFCSIASEISSGQSKRCNGILSGVSNSYLTAEQGGNGSMTYSYNNGEEGNHGILNALQALNVIDPITGIYGAYNSTTGEPISDYQTLSDYLTPLYNQTGYNQNIGLTAEGEKVQSYADDYQHTDFHMFQVTTKSGQVYNMDYGFQNPTGESDAGSISGKDLQGVGTYSMQNTETGETVGKSSCDFDGECYGI